MFSYVEMYPDFQISVTILQRQRKKGRVKRGDANELVMIKKERF